MRYFFEVAYNGKDYAGWQSQANAVSVQSVLEEGLSKIFRVPIKIVGSGRTDTGVHCMQQYFHADIDKPVDTARITGKLNSYFPKGIAIHSVRPVKADAHARFSAVERSYEYHITTRKDPFLQGLALHHFKDVDVQTMNRAAALLVGEHDFECFSKVKTDVNHFLCEVKRAQWTDKDHKLVFHITANRFLRGMVRAVVGTLLDVGEGKTSVKQFQQIISSRNRAAAGANVPPYGLYLARVKYPAHIFLPQGQ